MIFKLLFDHDSGILIQLLQKLGHNLIVFGIVFHLKLFVLSPFSFGLIMLSDNHLFIVRVELKNIIIFASGILFFWTIGCLCINSLEFVIRLGFIRVRIF